MDTLKNLVPASLQKRWGELRTFPTWSFDAAARRGRTMLQALKDKHRGERCFIIGNGPSLKTMDLRPLTHEFTFGLNRIYLLAETMDFAPTFHVTINQLVIEQCIDDLLAVPSMKFMSWKARRYIGADAPVALLRSMPGLNFSTDAAWGVWEGATVTYVAMQLAYYMGFQKVILVGVDHNFHTKGPPHKVVVSEGPDPNHFAPNYFGKHFRWQLPDLPTSEKAYTLAREAFEADGRLIVDATVGGMLDVFPKVAYETCLHSPTGHAV